MVSKKKKVPALISVDGHPFQSIVHLKPEKCLSLKLGKGTETEEDPKFPKIPDVVHSKPKVYNSGINSVGCQCDPSTSKTSQQDFVWFSFETLSCYADRAGLRLIHKIFLYRGVKGSTQPECPSGPLEPLTHSVPNCQQGLGTTGQM